MWKSNQKSFFVCGLLLTMSLQGPFHASPRPQVSRPLSRQAETKLIRTGPCQQGTTSASYGSWRWNPNTAVKVHYRSGQFTDNDVISFAEAVSHWNSALLQTDIGIRFELKGET